MKEFTQTLYSVADDAYMNVEFNPAYVKQYRLIGFDNRVGALNDTSAVVEGGEIGSGYSMMGIFEIEPNKSDTTVIERFARIRVTFRKAGDSVQQAFNYRSPYDFEPFTTVDRSYRFSAAVAQFGQMLRSSAFTRVLTWNEMVVLAAATVDPQDKKQQEFLSLVQQAKVLYGKTKKKKKGQGEQ